MSGPLKLGSPVLRAVSNGLSRIATGGRPCYPQGWRFRVHCIAMALDWMCKGNKWDTRALRQRWADSRYFWLRAVGVSHTRAVTRHRLPRRP